MTQIRRNPIGVVRTLDTGPQACGRELRIAQGGYDKGSASPESMATLKAHPIGYRRHKLVPPRPPLRSIPTQRTPHKQLTPYSQKKEKPG
jgi:hypothetical protein